ncbi:hypothetical protein [Schleiferilactobacillus perolens]|jgi:hypothetical protein|uniref:hypothetical protein n=1 Tax=Schleiferilactobacillus perolens TaxID=100468 RepID=UPI0023527872|nr:hypothetical protein [Schleiferilactobacillus perolens]MCI2170028.1 hypothetical protein [Schleiferilactobacillus perolens]
MADRKATPIAKIYEALSAIADKRVTFPADQPGEALVVSSDHSKQYTVRFGDGFYSANDNATYWQHYAGYPIVAVLIEQHKIGLPSNSEKIVQAFAGVDWKSLNTQYKNDYDKSTADFLSQVDDPKPLQKLVRIIDDQLGALDFEVKGNRAQMRHPEQ